MFKILFIILLFVYTDIHANKNTGRISFGGGIHNFMKNGYAVCENPALGGCDPNSNSQAVLPVDYKDISTVFSFEYFAKRNIFNKSMLNRFPIFFASGPETLITAMPDFPGAEDKA